MIRHLLLSGGPTHEFATTSGLLADLLTDHGVTTTIVTEPADAGAVLRAAEDGTGEAVDLLTVNALRWRMDQERYAHQRADHAVVLDTADLAVLDRFVRTGGGLLALHTAVICFDADPVWHTLCGASWNWERSTHPPLGPVAVDVTAAGRRHPLTTGLPSFSVEDEAYAFLDTDPDIEPLLVTAHDGATHPLLWARAVGQGRVVTDLLGHGPASFAHPTHASILARAATWATGGRTTPAATTRSPA